MHDLTRFHDAQAGTFETALAELRAGRKRSHWMWFVFPQLRSLGRSSTAKYYGIGSTSTRRAPTWPTPSSAPGWSRPRPPC